MAKKRSLDPHILHMLRTFLMYSRVRYEDCTVTNLSSRKVWEAGVIRFYSLSYDACVFPGL